MNDTASPSDAARAPERTMGPFVESKGRRITTNRGGIHFLREGRGGSMLFLHGMGSDHRSFEAVASRFVDGHDVILPDLLGHGASDLGVPDLSVMAQSTALSQFLSDLEVHQVTLVGHDLGGAVALRVAAMAPERVKKLVLIAAGSYESRLPLALRLLRRPLVWSALGMMGRRARQQCVARVRGIDPAPGSVPDPCPVTDRDAWASLGRTFHQFTAEGAISEIEDIVEHFLVQPTLVLWGSDDRVSPVGSARVLYREKRNVRFIEIARSRHAPHEEQPGIVADQIRDFLE